MFGKYDKAAMDISEEAEKLRHEWEACCLGSTKPGVPHNPKSKDIIRECEIITKEIDLLERAVLELLSRLNPFRNQIPHPEGDDCQEKVNTSKFAEFVRTERLKISGLNNLVSECLNDLQI